ncbi:HU family DNA-binding protein [Microtetraspora malaysiensis]|uniref:HU family DNA-binding protein n=1 Tax=Microtetraspora malaysiensis TaxID=161358 RepID=UPI003D8C7165
MEAGARAYLPAVKTAFQAQRRWWEQDHGIYGGISWTTRDITQMWYPSAGVHGRKGILLGAYIWSEYRMNKKELVEAFRQRTDAPSRAAAERSVEALIDIIVGTVAAAGEVRIGGLGVFERVYREGRAARNPNTGDKINVPGHFVFRFRAAKDAKDAIQ